MSVIKHSKIKNTGILFELLVRQITSDTLEGKDSKAVNILKKYFTKTELGKEYKLYEALLKNTQLTGGKANMIISSLIEMSRKLDENKLKKEKYNLIKEIKQHYNLDEFFKTKLPNYKAQAAFYVLLEIERDKNSNFYTNQVLSNKSTLLEHLTHKPDMDITKNILMEEFSSYDRDIRILTYKLLLEKFNNKYNTLSSKQKEVLKEYINLKDSAPVLREFYNRRIKEVKTLLKESNKKTLNPATKIKVDSVCLLMEELKTQNKINSDIIVNLMQYYDLLNELEVANKK